MIDMYQAVALTILILSQVIRIAQNAAHLKMIRRNVDDLSEVTDADIKRRREVDTAILEYLKGENPTDGNQ